MSIYDTPSVLKAKRRYQNMRRRWNAGYVSDNAVIQATLDVVDALQNLDPHGTDPELNRLCEHYQKEYQRIQNLETY